MKTEAERKSAEKFALQNGKNMADEAGDSARSLGILIGLCLGAAVGFGIYGLAKLLG